MLVKRIIMIFILAVVIIIALYSGLVIRRYKIDTKKIEKNTDINIVLVADLHSCYFGKQQKRIIDKIQKQQPDLILLAGDIIDDRRPVETGIIFMQRVSKIAPTYYVAGNHEFWIDDYEAVQRMVDETDVVTLDCNKQSISINNFDIDIYGIKDPSFFEKNPARVDRSKNTHMHSEWKNTLSVLTEQLDKDKYNILLAHRPNYIEEFEKYEYDLIVSGHAHGGQVRIPYILNGLFAPNQGLFPKNAGGVYNYNNTTHVVSRGVCTNFLLPRVFNPPEIVTIKLKHPQDEIN